MTSYSKVSFLCFSLTNTRHTLHTDSFSRSLCIPDSFHFTKQSDSHLQTHRNHIACQIVSPLSYASSSQPPTVRIASHKSSSSSILSRSFYMSLIVRHHPFS